MKILFVCKYNRFRSRLAEAHFKKINKNKKIKVDSAGLFQGRPTCKNETDFAKKEGLNIKGKPKAMSSELLKKQDIIILVANDVPSSIFDKKFKKEKKVIAWKIKDAKDTDKKGLKRIIKAIRIKTDKLSKSLEGKK